MSMKASRFSKTRSSRVNRERMTEFQIEQEEYFMSPIRTTKYSNNRPNSPSWWDNEYFYQVMAYVIATGKAPFIFNELDSIHEIGISMIQSLRKELWGFDQVFNDAKDVKLLGEVLQVLKISSPNLEELTKIVTFVRFLPLNCEFEDWEIKADWTQFKKSGSISLCLDNPEESFTTERDSNLKRYSYDVLNVATEKVSNKLGQSPLMGVELEFTSPDCYLDRLMPVLSFGIFKSDSTTDVEWVSLPLEYQELKEQFKKKTASFNVMLENNGAESNGMHVHVTKSFLSFAQEARIYYLINAKGNRKYWTKLADRDVQNNSYCHFVDLSYGLVSAVKGNDYSSLSESHFCDERGVTINRTKGPTLEFRFFKSPDNVEKVIENLRVVQAILEYTAKGGYNLKGFIKFLKQFDV